MSHSIYSGGNMHQVFAMFDNWKSMSVQAWWWAAAVLAKPSAGLFEEEVSSRGTTALTGLPWQEIRAKTMDVSFVIVSRQKMTSSDSWTTFWAIQFLMTAERWWRKARLFRVLGLAQLHRCVSSAYWPECVCNKKTSCMLKSVTAGTHSGWEVN